MSKTTKEKFEALKEYMEVEFGVTPENIDSKLEELKAEFHRRLEKPDVA